MSKLGKSKKNGYALKRKTQGADAYGAWSAGVQLRADVIAGRVLTYNARTGNWGASA